MTDQLRRQAGAEFLGTFMLVFVGAGSALAGGSLVVVALAHGLTIAVMVAAVFGVSGAHFNPAVTLGLLLTNRIAPRRAAVYVLAQCLAALAAAILLRSTLPGALHGSLSVPTLGSGQIDAGTWQVTAGQGLLLEAVLTFFLVFVIFAVAVDDKAPFPAITALAIGFAVAAGALMGGPLSGAAMNPARWLGPALAGGELANWFVWLVGPLAGGSLAALVHDGAIVRPREAAAAT